ncbi:MAG: hypothetical protein Udaeo2_21320 [Candidatus Udaeobacter sp.]|nr:MAG: hypothetical protein Udaeo2_21320 [Candidatus Udaeobacter sp.]
MRIVLGSHHASNATEPRAPASRTKKPRIRPSLSTRLRWGIVSRHASRGSRGRRRFSDRELRRRGGIRYRQHLRRENVLPRSVSSPSAAASCAALSASRSKPRDYRVHDTLLVAGPTAIAPSSKRVLAYLRCEAASRVALRPFAQVRSFWPRLESSMAGEPPHIGCLPASCRPDIQKCAWRRPHFHARRSCVTSAGMTAGIDLALALVEADLVPTSRGRSRKGWSCITGAAAHRGRNQHCSRWRRSRIEYRQHSRMRGRIFVRPLRGRTRRSSASQRASVHARSDRRRGQFSRKGRRSATSRSRARDARRRLHSVEEVADETGFGERARGCVVHSVRAFGRPPQAVRRDLREVRR